MMLVKDHIQGPSDGETSSLARKAQTSEEEMLGLGWEDITRMLLSSKELMQEHVVGGNVQRKRDRVPPVYLEEEEKGSVWYEIRARPEDRVQCAKEY